MNILKTNELTKKFGALKAVNKLNLEIEKGKITSLIGPNGAGKSTFLNLISSIHEVTNGSVYFKDEEITNLPKHKIAKKGIGRTYQSIKLFNDLTVLDNILASRYIFYKSNIIDAILGRKKYKQEEQKQKEKAFELLEVVGLEKHYKSYPDSLPYGFRRSLEIARALALEPSLLLLDEPAAGMNKDEFNKLEEIIFEINNRGITILFVEHTMSMVKKISDHVIVLNHGEKLAEGSFNEIENNPEVVKAYLGGEI